VDLLIVAPRWFGIRLPAPVRIWAVLIPVLAVVDILLRDNHGVAALLGMLIGLVMLGPLGHRERPIASDITTPR
jgi:hypothetical protein